MITLRPSNERGSFDYGWLKTSHTFSFGEYHDRSWMGFRSLRVLNEDRVAPGKGFPNHPHRDAEILSLVLEGTLAHKDSMGNSGLIRAGELQYMSAGSGVTHSEYNGSTRDPVHFIQIWMKPAELGAPPRYDHKVLAESKGPLNLLASGDPNDGVTVFRQDARLYLAQPARGESVDINVGAGRHLWIQVLTGRFSVLDRELKSGDGAGISDTPTVSLTSLEPESKALVFNLG